MKRDWKNETNIKVSNQISLIKSNNIKVGLNFDSG